MWSFDTISSQSILVADCPRQWWIFVINRFFLENPPSKTIFHQSHKANLMMSRRHRGNDPFMHCIQCVTIHFKRIKAFKSFEIISDREGIGSSPDQILTGPRSWIACYRKPDAMRSWRRPGGRKVGNSLLITSESPSWVKFLLIQSPQRAT